MNFEECYKGERPDAAGRRGRQVKLAAWLSWMRHMPCPGWEIYTSFFGA